MKNKLDVNEFVQYKKYEYNHLESEINKKKVLLFPWESFSDHVLVKNAYTKMKPLSKNLHININLRYYKNTTGALTSFPSTGQWPPYVASPFWFTLICAKNRENLLQLLWECQLLFKRMWYDRHGSIMDSGSTYSSTMC